ncbi:unnamed protein product [Rotaria sp. Silwood2]|nr:unnamed protein product [Rotaria sp. Silwood2]CAF4313924.1 unnamed protein product [Rotaria sp. Silwood2]
MFAYRALVISSETIESIIMKTKFNLKASQNIYGEAFMDFGDERGFMKLNIDERASSLAKSWIRTLQHLPWTLDLRNDKNRILTSITEACGLGVTNARMSFSANDQQVRSGLILRTAYNFGLNSDFSESGLQWIVWLMSETPAALANLAGAPGLLCQPSRFQGVRSWAKPGKVGRDMALSTVSAKLWMNLAQTADLHYILFDAGFYGDEYSHTSDPLKPLESPKSSPFNISAIIEYGKSLPQPIGIMGSRWRENGFCASSKPSWNATSDAKHRNIRAGTIVC